ncbi:YqhA family protein [Magnetococcales bacterium HHB-1]
MFKAFFALRYVSITSVIFSFIGSIVMFAAGVYKTVKAIKIFLGLKIPQEMQEYGASKMDLTMIGMIEAVDAFLFALVLMIFSYGIYVLFITNPTELEKRGYKLPKWMRFQDIAQLKIVLAEVIVIILFVLFLKEILLEIDHLKWTLMIFPLSILLMAGALKLLHPSDHH